MEKLTNGDTKPVTGEPPKTSYNSSKPIKQSKRSNLQAETVEKPSILELESATINRSKTTTKLSNPIKPEKNDIQKPKQKIEVYTEFMLIVRVN